MHKQPLIKKLLRYTRNLLIFFFASTLLAVIIYRFMPVYVTPLMVIRSVQQVFSGDKPTWKHTWVSFDKISPNLPMAVYFTFLIELFWSKERIMEVYLNSIEMGNGIYGAQATAKNKFGTTADKLTRGQCALIAATLPNPIRFNSAKPSSYILKRQSQILRLMNLVPKFPPEEKAVEKKKSKKKKSK